jgi:MFS family permease
MRQKGFLTSRTVLGLICIMYAITYIDRVNVSTASSVFQKQLHLSSMQVGLVFSAFAYPYLVFQLVGGWISDRFGARLTLTVSAIIWAVATIFTGLAGGLASMLCARVMLGFGEGATFPAATRAMSDWTREEDRGFSQGITHSSARLGNALTPPLVVWLMALVTWRGSFILLGVISLAWAVVWVWYFRNNPKEHAAISSAELQALPDYALRTVQKHEAVPWLCLAHRMFPVTLVYFCYGWTLWLYLAWMPSYFVHSYGLDLKQSSLFSAGVFFAGVLGDALGGTVSDLIFRRTGDLNKARRNLVVFSYFCSMSCLIPIFFSHNLTSAAIYLSLGFFFAELTIGPMWAIPMDIAPRYPGSASGLMSTGSPLAAILSPLAFGYVIDRTGNWDLPFLGSIVLLFLGSIAAFWMKPGEPLLAPLPIHGYDNGFPSKY